MNENAREEVPLKPIDDDASDGKLNAMEPNEHAPLKDDGGDAEGGQTNHASDGAAGGTVAAAETSANETWFNRNMSRPRLVIVVGLIAFVIILIVVVPVVLTTAANSMPDMIEADVDDRLSLLEYYPNGARNKSQIGRRNLIRFKRGSNGTWKSLTQELDAVLSRQFKLNRVLGSSFMGSPCVTENNYGYDVGEPCIFIQFNKIKNWVPDIYTRSEIIADQKGEKKLPEGMLTSSRVVLVYVNCEGDTVVDKEMADKIHHIPRPGFFASSFPYTDEPFSTAPMFAIHMKNAERDIAINIECKIWANNVHHDDPDEEPKGSIYFTLMIE